MAQRFAPIGILPQDKRILESYGSPALAYSIYALLDPRDGSVRYVGVTSQSLDARLRQHIERPSNYGVKMWVRDLKESAREPQASLITLCTKRTWSKAERYWIAWFNARGRIYNVHRGGYFHKDTREQDRLRKPRRRGRLRELSPPSVPPAPGPDADFWEVYQYETARKAALAVIRAT